MARGSPGTGGDPSSFTERFDDDLEVDRPGSIRILRAIGTALAVDLVSVPIALFVAGLPLLRLMNRPATPRTIARQPRAV